MKATTTLRFASTAIAGRSAFCPAVLTRTGGRNVTPRSAERVTQISPIAPFCAVYATYGFPAESSARTPPVAVAAFAETFSGADQVRPRSVDRRYTTSQPVTFCVSSS